MPGAKMVRKIDIMLAINKIEYLYEFVLKTINK